MSWFKSLWREAFTRDSAGDFAAAALASLATLGFWVLFSYTPMFDYLRVIGARLVPQVPQALGVVLILRLVARGTARLYPARLRFLHRVAAPSNRAYFFSTPTWFAALVALIEISPPAAVEPPWLLWATQFGAIALICAVDTLCGLPFLQGKDGVSAEDSGDEQPTSNAQPASSPFGALWSLTGSLASTFCLIVVGEALVTQLTPWRTYPSADSIGPPYAEPVGDGSELTLTPHSIARVRYTPTRRDIDIERGDVMVRLDRCDSPGELNTRPRVVVQAGTTILTLAKPGSACRLGGPTSTALKTKEGVRPFGMDLAEADENRIYANNEILIQREDAMTSLLVKDGTDVRLAGPSRRWWARWLPADRSLKPGELAVVYDEHLHIEVPTPQERRDRLAWVSGGLSFHNVPLAEAVKQINRFSTSPLEIQDDSIAALPITGEFRYFRHSSLAERFVVALERDGKARRTPKGVTDPAIGLVAYDASPEDYGPVAQQVTTDLCASYRGDHDRSNTMYDPSNPNPEATFNVAGCDVATALAGFSQQSGFRYELVVAPEGMTMTHPLNGRYSAKDALATMLQGTGCRAGGDVVTGLKIACVRGQLANARELPGRQR